MSNFSRTGAELVVQSNHSRLPKHSGPVHYDLHLEKRQVTFIVVVSLSGSQPGRPTSPEEVKLRFRRSEQRLVNKDEFMRGQLTTVVVTNKTRKTVAFCEIYVVRIVEHSIKNFISSRILKQHCSYCHYIP